MSAQIDWDFAGEDEAKAEIGAAVRYLLRDATGSGRSDIVWEITEHVRDVANRLPENSPDARAAKQPATNGISYKDYVIDAFRRDSENWRANIRRSNGKKIRVAIPPSVLDVAMTSADAFSAEKAVELAKRAIDDGGLS